MAAKILLGTYLMTPDGLKRNWGLRVKENIITQVGPIDSITLEDGDEVITLSNQIILPGFVNGHNHMYGFLSHGITAETMVTEFSSFLEDFWWPYVENRLNHKLVAATAKMACIEMIDSGVTSFVDILEGPYSIPGALTVEEEIVRKAGLRGRLSFEACERISKDNGQSGLKENMEFIRNHNRPGARVDGFVSIHTLFTCSGEFIKQAKTEADKENCLIHMHLSESAFEPEWCKKHYDKTPVSIYEELGFLDQQVLASQVVQVSGEELDILARHKVNVVSMPLSNCEVGGGFAPVSKMLDKGITVGLGTDGYINNFFEVMRGAFLMHKANQQDPQIMSAKSVFDMGTSMGAKAIGIPETGMLQEGKLADIITVSMEIPTPVNEHNVYDQIILFMNPANVINVMVDGKWVKKDGQIITMNKQKIMEELRSVTEQFWNIHNS